MRLNEVKVRPKYDLHLTNEERECLIRLCNCLKTNIAETNNFVPFTAFVDNLLVTLTNPKRG